jgi:hypothetical protein
MHATQGARHRACSARILYVFSGVTIRNCLLLELEEFLFAFDKELREPPLVAEGATSTAAFDRSTLTLGPILDARRCMVSAPGVVAASHRFCHRRKLPCHTLTYPSGGSAECAKCVPMSRTWRGSSGPRSK